MPEPSPLFCLTQSGGTELCGAQAAISRAVDQPQVRNHPESLHWQWKPFWTVPLYKVHWAALGDFLVYWHRLFLVTPRILPSVVSCSRSPSLSAHSLVLWSPSFPARTDRACIHFFLIIVSMRDALNTRLKLDARHFTFAGERALHSYFPPPLSVWFTFKQITRSFLDNLSLSFFSLVVSHSKVPKVI